MKDPCDCLDCVLFSRAASIHFVRYGDVNILTRYHVRNIIGGLVLAKLCEFLGLGDA